MKRILHVAIFLSCNLFFQASEFNQEQVNTLSRPLISVLDIDEKISQHLINTGENRKKVLLDCAQILTVSNRQDKITRGKLKDVCSRLSQVLLDTPVDKKISDQVANITNDFRGVTCSSCYGCLPFWASYSNARIRQEAVDLKKVINIGLQDIESQDSSLNSYALPSNTTQIASAPYPMIAAASSQNPAFIENKYEN